MPPSRRPPTPAQTLRRSTLALLAFWLLVAGALWWGFAWWDARQRAGLAPYLLTGGELVIPRSPDGHFYVPGEINRQPVRFVVDTGASSVRSAPAWRVRRACPKDARSPSAPPMARARRGWCMACRSRPVRWRKTTSA